MRGAELRNIRRITDEECFFPIRVQPLHHEPTAIHSERRETSDFVIVHMEAINHTSLVLVWIDLGRVSPKLKSLWVENAHSRCGLTSRVTSMCVPYDARLVR